MTYARPRGLISRFRSLVRGMFSIWLKEKEFESPEAVYEQAIGERVRQYRELKAAVAGILFMRTKLEAEVTERRAEIARLHDDVKRAVRNGQEETSLTLITHKQALFDDLERSEDELKGVRSQAEEAKDNLVRFREEIRALVREKGRMLATLANAKARRRLQVAIEGLSVDAEMDALESVREQISRIAVEGDLDTEIGDTTLRSRLREYRDEARVEAARTELEQLKSEMSGQLPANAQPQSSKSVPSTATAPAAATG